MSKGAAALSVALEARDQALAISGVARFEAEGAEGGPPREPREVGGLLLTQRGGRVGGYLMQCMWVTPASKRFEYSFKPTNMDSVPGRGPKPAAKP